MAPPSVNQARRHAARIAREARFAAMQAEIRAAEQAAAARVSPETVARARESIGWRAAPRLVSDPATPTPFAQSAGQITVQPAAMDEVKALADKALKYQQDVAATGSGTPLTDAELLTLVQSGADVGAILSRQLTLPELQQVIRNVTKGETISPEAAAALLRTPQSRVVENLWQGEPTPAQAQALSQDFGIKMGGEENLTPNYVKENPLANIAQSVRQYTTPTRLEAVDVDAVRALWRQIEENFPAGSQQRAELEQAFANWKPNPSNPDGPVPDYAMRGIDDGRRRLEALQQMATDPAFTQRNVAAAALGRSADALGVSGQPKSVRASFVPEQPGLAAAAERFNQLPPEVRRQVATFLERDEAARSVNAAMALDMQGGEVSISPNTVAQSMRGIDGNPVSDLLDELDVALETGDQATADAVRALVLEQPAEVRSEAISHHRRRLALDAALRRGMAAVEPPPQAMASPGQPSLRGQGDLTPEYKTESTPDDTTAFDEARAAWNEAAPQREAGGPRTHHVTRERRLAALGRKLQRTDDGDLPVVGRQDGMFWKGGNERPLESRADSDRLIDSNDRKVIAAYRNAEAARKAVDEAMKAASAPGLSTGELARATARVEEAQKALEEAASKVAAINSSASTQPRWVNSKTGEVVRADMEAEFGRKYPDDNINSIRSKLAAAGWEYEAGRKGWSDARLTKAASEQTWEDLVAGQLEGRPKAETNLNRSSDTLSAADQRQQLQDAEEALDGDLPEPPDVLGETLDDLDPDPAKRGRLGGGRSAARRTTALQGADTAGMFGPHNPLRVIDPETGFPLYRDDVDASGKVTKTAAEKLAEDVLEDTKSYRRGTGLYENARASLAKLYDDTYNVPNNEFAGKRWSEETGQWEDASSDAAPAANPASDVRAGTSQDPLAVPAQQGAWPAGTMQQTAGAPPTPASPNAWDLPEPPATPEEFARRLAEYENTVLNPNYDPLSPKYDPSIPVALKPAAPRGGQDFSAPATVPQEADLASFPQRGAARDAEQAFPGNPDDVAVELRGKARRRKPAAADAGVSDNLDASATDITDVSGNDPAAAVAAPDKTPAKPRRRRKGTAAAGGEQIEPVSGSDAGGATPAARDGIADATPSEELDAETLRDIEAQADQLEEEEIRQHQDAGETRDAAKQYARESRAKNVADLKAQAVQARKKRGGAATVAPTSGKDPAPATSVADNVTDNLDASATNLDPVTGDDSLDSVGVGTPKVFDDTPDDTDPTPSSLRVIDNRTDADTPGKTADGTTTVTTTQKGRRWPWIVGGLAGAAGGLGGLVKLNAPGDFDLPVPAGGPGGGRPGGQDGGDFFPMPGDLDGGSASGASAEEDAINRALERIRGSRNPGGQPPMYQTYQTYNVWR